jgi:hypothetical protein
MGIDFGARGSLTLVSCQAILRYDQRIALDGALAEAVDAKAQDLASQRLAKLAERTAARQSEAVKPKLRTPTPPAETPEQLRARVRASLLRRSA